MSIIAKDISCYETFLLFFIKSKWVYDAEGLTLVGIRYKTLFGKKYVLEETRETLKEIK